MKNNENKSNDIIKKGWFHYILVYGVLFWGFGTAILFSLLQHFIGSTQTLSTLAISFITFPIAGIFWGAFMWFFVIKRRKGENIHTRE